MVVQDIFYKKGEEDQEDKNDALAEEIAMGMMSPDARRGEVPKALDILPEIEG